MLNDNYDEIQKNKYYKCELCQYKEMDEDVYEVTGCSLKQNIDNKSCLFFYKEEEI